MIVEVPTEMTDLDAARGYAVAVARRIMALVRDCGDKRRSWQIAITDGQGQVLLTVPFTDPITIGRA